MIKVAKVELVGAHFVPGIIMGRNRLHIFQGLDYS
jgi:hypothetical protein